MENGGTIWWKTWQNWPKLPHFRAYGPAKNLKKVLALVLVVAMMASFAVSASATFTDADTINYTEAVEVLTGLEVIGGYTDGSFRPTGNVTRGAFAKMVAYVMNGGTNAAASYGAAAAVAFGDVETTDTFANAIGYVVSKGIVSGYADDTFRAGNSVTGVAAAKMLLGALGYDATAEGYTGTGWTTNVINAAQEAGLFAGLVDVDLTAALSREAAAQMIYNALSANMVKYTTSGTTITAGDVTITTSAIRSELSTTLVEKCFGAKIDEAPTTDALGHPGTLYSLNGDVLATIYETAAKTYTTPVTGAGLYKDFGLKASVSIDYVTNGKTVLSGSTTITADGGAITVAGETTEVFVDAKGIPTKIVVTAPSVATVTAVTNVAATATAGAYTSYSFSNGMTAKVFTSVVNKDADITTLHGTCAKGETVLVHTDNKGHVYVSGLTAIEAVVSAYNSTTGVYTIGGAAYTLAAKGEVSSLSVAKDAVKLYVADGYVWAGVGAVVTADPYCMILGVDDTTALVNGKLVTTYTATVATTEGTIETLAISEAWYNLIKAQPIGGIVTTYKYDTANAVYTFGNGVAANVTNLTTGNTTLAAGLYGNAATLFIFADYNAKGELAGTVTTVTGVSNIGSYKTVSAVAMDLTNDKIADVVFVTSNATATTTVKSLTYIVPGYTQTLDGYVYSTVVDGVAGSITLPATIAAGMYSEISVTGTTVSATSADVTHTSVKYVGGLLLDGNDALIGTVSESVPVYTIVASDFSYAASIGVAAELTAGVTGSIYVLTANGAVTAIYVVA